MKRINFSSGAPLEELVGYSRMVKVGEHIYIGALPPSFRTEPSTEIQHWNRQIISSGNLLTY
ncbi:hypothetical protein [Lacrimispora xylanisolvens]|uniref:hypothetical protein n=1 Tax=Lacrimispora xylanisolvens TaxID=384636 RepID=UPI0032E802EA